jgi:leucyl-tRNA---protein transferase
LIDFLEDGISMIYSFFRPDETQRSLGTQLILEAIKLARERNLKYVYLGYLIKSARTMTYKSKFLPQQRLGGQGWITVESE